MSYQLKIFNSLKEKKEIFCASIPKQCRNVCLRPYGVQQCAFGKCAYLYVVCFVYRTLKFLGYKVRYVRNITDAGHLTDDGDVNNDRFVKQSRLEKLEPMEIVQKYTVDFHKVWIYSIFFRRLQNLLRQDIFWNKYSLQKNS